MKLVNFLMRLNNETVQIEMKNGTVVQGTMTGCDTSMNTHVKNVTMIVRRRPAVTLEHLTIRGPTIRYIFLNEELDLDKKLLDDAVKERTKPPKRKRGRRGFGAVAPKGVGIGKGKGKGKK
ncbi:unnamed protein product [Amoebophrya sp. A25]|nr:unnamed protein product [Amoebophrya sp. A25]|eukprot:GSA25T00020775001.1